MYLYVKTTSVVETFYLATDYAGNSRTKQEGNNDLRITYLENRRQKHIKLNGSRVYHGYKRAFET